MSNFLSAAENVAWQRENIRCDLKMMEEESRAAERLERHNLVYFLDVMYRKYVSITVR